MREIKFRAWDTANKCWFKNTNAQGNPLTNYVVDFDGFLWEKNSDDSLERKRFVLMQYTGLKDKNGKEIYEGDIVKVGEIENIHVPPNKYHYIVCYDHGQYIAFQNNNRAYLLSERPSEIIGNIYENGDLIKDLGSGKLTE